MKTIFKSLLFICLFASCSASKKITDLNQVQNQNPPNIEMDGLSYEKAIVIMEKTESKGVSAEYDWVKKHYPGYKLNSQSLNIKDKKYFDILKIKTKEGEDLELYFDISNFFGKF